MNKPKVVSRNLYEVMIPYHQYLHYTLEADSPEHAVFLAENNQDADGNNISEYCSTSCGAGAKTIVRDVSKVSGES